jgi:hypothetical protein
MSANRLRVLLVSLLAVFAVSAVASASASANDKCHPHEGEKGNVDFELCIENEEVASPNEHVPIGFTSTKKAATKSKLEVKEGPLLECTAANNEGQFDKKNGNIKDDNTSVEVSDLIIVFTGCKVKNTATTEANCEVASPAKEEIRVEGEAKEGIFDQLDGRFLKVNEIEFYPSFNGKGNELKDEGEVFVEITIKNVVGKECVFKIAKAKVTGTQKCTVTAPETEAVEKELVCATTGSKLTFAAKEAKFELTELVKLKEPFLGKNWSIVSS